MNTLVACSIFLVVVGGVGPLNICFNEVNKAKLFTLVRVLSSP